MCRTVLLTAIAACLLSIGFLYIYNRSLRISEYEILTAHEEAQKNNSKLIEKLRKRVEALKLHIEVVLQKNHQNNFAAVQRQQGLLYSCFNCSCPLRLPDPRFNPPPVCSSQLPPPVAYSDEPFNATDPSVCSIVRTYNKHVRNGQLLAMVLSLLQKRPPRAIVFLVATDPREPAETRGLFKNLADQVNALYNQTYVVVSPASHKESLQIWPNIVEDFGYLSTDVVLELVLNATSIEDISWPPRSIAIPAGTKPKYLCDYFLVTNGDNLYAARFLPAVMRQLRQEKDLVGVEYVSHYASHPGLPYVPGESVARYGRDQQRFSQFGVGMIDLGAMLFKAQRIRDSTVRFCLDEVRTKNNTKCSLLADGMFADKLLALPNITRVILRETLFVHQ